MKRARACGNSNACVHAGAVPADDPDLILIKVAGHPDGGPFLMFTEEEWSVFVEGAKAGEFDTDRLVAEAAPEFPLGRALGLELGGVR